MNDISPAAPNGVAQHAQLELETLGHIKSALSNAIAADFGEADLGRKLANVRFVAGSFQRYVERLFALEEHDGYMRPLVDSHPHLQRQIEELCTDHRKIRERFREIVVRLESLSAADASDFHQSCDDIAKLISKVDAHTKAETGLLQSAYNWDIGGEA
jgi:hypothetical protein